MKRASKWKMFKLMWLVPNYRWSRGPAWWIWNLMDWCRRNWDPHNYCGLRHKIHEFVDEKLMKWLTPWLWRARELLDFAREANGTKLLASGANWFRVRTRGVDQIYIEARASLFGNVAVTETRYVDSKGKSHNIFLSGLVGTVDGETLKEQRKYIFSKHIFTKKQLEEAREWLMKHHEFEWDWLGIAEDRLVEALKPKDPHEFKMLLSQAVVDAVFPQVDDWINLEGKDWDQFSKIICSLTPEVAQKLVEDKLKSLKVEEPALCITLTESTIEKNLALLEKNKQYVDMVELRVDFLEKSEVERALDFPKLAGIPTVLTIRRVVDGGQWDGSEEKRAEIFEHLLKEAPMPFSFVDFEEDIHDLPSARAAHARGTKIIRSVHDFNGPIKEAKKKCIELRGDTDEIPKLAFKVNHCWELEDLFKDTASFTEFPHIICAMGPVGIASRILASRTHSMLVFSSAVLKGIGQISPQEMKETYRFHKINRSTELYAVTGWPLLTTGSPQLNNDAFKEAGRNAVMFPLPAETPEEALHFAEAVGVKGMAVTVPHKQTIMPLLASTSADAEKIGAVNTVVKTSSGWCGYNTDAPGFKRALEKFIGVTSLFGRKVAIIGAGGAARAVACAVAELGGDACIFGRTIEKAESLAKLYGFKAAPLDLCSLELLDDYRSLIIQCTSVGYGDGQGDPLSFYSFKGDEVVYDVIYTPRETPILRRARLAGCRTCNGWKMLEAQAEEQRRLYQEASK